MVPTTVDALPLQGRAVRAIYNELELAFLQLPLVTKKIWTDCTNLRQFLLIELPAIGVFEHLCEHVERHSACEISFPLFLDV